ncbi:MAG: hypothetical protein BGO49_02145 [Planctomycetales bacterium 71-10]|nr:MAG: hypothetical protein BGO49_02145 [Planctomycetales bacterium 71-10]
MRKSIGMTVLAFATCIPIGVATGTAARTKGAAAQAAQTERQAVGKAFIPSDLDAQAALRQQDMTWYRGTEIGPDPDADGLKLELHTRIGQIFALHDPPSSPARLAHFAWLDRPDVKINGWYGTIKAVVQDGDHMLVRVQILPHLASESGAITSTTASYLETYAVSDDGVQFLGGEAPKTGPNFLMTD